jgi:hypothetical protein
MRNGQNKRMRGRNRNSGVSGGGGGNKGHHHHHNPLTRVYESNGPEVKIRGTAHHIAEKYLQLARDASSSGDPVTAENHYQHAEHYLRLIAAAQEQFRQQNPYYQPQQSTPGEEDRDGSDFDGEGDGQSMQGQQNFGNQQPPYPPREQPYGGQQQQQHQSRPEHQQQAQQYQQPQQHQQPAPQQQPQEPQPSNFEGTVGLPSFITGAQPQQAPAFGQNGRDNDQADGDRFPHRRRRRHRSGTRPDAPNGQEFRGNAPDAPGNE